MAGSFLDITGLSHFKDKLLVKIQEMINESLGASRKTEVIEQMVRFYNGYTGSDLDYRDYLDATEGEVADALYSFGSGYNGS